MREQRLATVRVKRRKRIPQLRRLIGQSRHPRLMATKEVCCERGVVETGRLGAEADTFQIDLQTGVRESSDRTL